VHAPHPTLPSRRPFIVGHRAGNNLADADKAIRLGVDMIEADVWRYHKRLEVRHLKTLGPLPLLWDRWRLAPGWTPRVRVAHLLEATPAELPIMFDLKGDDPSLSAELIDAIENHDPQRAIILCTSDWIHLDRVRERPNVHRIYSVGDESERDRVWSRIESMEHPAISIHRRLVTPALMARLKEIGATVISWGSSSRADAELMLSLGVDGLTVADGPLRSWLIQEGAGR
jgi:glycerophosphoryl diester phosphodiesterase